ncbi:hypothetical protein FHT87_004613 [Rhizobium sp. BK316]|uniref:hypothetical protein n=1 Tax=Rhizobium sp. BK316 TaxID=2587053 RepID=UPI00161CCB29|nr:hypothetical protein [Rhizobium sp. BK316]MBB3410681.1 hypothetical protein [Rhizobium sp. BK316]
MSSRRIDFSSDAATFNEQRDEWRSMGVSLPGLPKAGLRVAAVLPGFLNRDLGYAFPTDEQLAEAIGGDVKTAKRGLSFLEDAGALERVTQPKRDDKGVVVGKLRRIYLTSPDIAKQPEPKGQDEAAGQSPKGHLPKGQPEPKGQKRSTEGTPVCPYIPDSNTPDKDSACPWEDVGGYARGSETVPSAAARNVPSVPRHFVPSAYREDLEFLNTFDEIVVEMTDGKTIAAGAMDRIVQQAFDKTTDGNDLFMPFHWRDVCALRSRETEDWFRQRVGQVIHRKAA